MNTRTLTAPKAVSEAREQLAPDSYPCRLVSFIYLGTQPSKNPKFPKDKIKFRMTFEFPTELKEFKEWEGKKPYILSREFTLSMFKTGLLRPFIESMIWKTLSDNEADQFDVLSLMEQPYFASVIENEAKYSDIQNVTKLPKTIVCPDQINPTSIILIEDWVKELDSLPEFIQNKIKNSREYQSWLHEINRDKTPVKISLDDVPF